MSLHRLLIELLGGWDKARQNQCWKQQRDNANGVDKLIWRNQKTNRSIQQDQTPQQRDNGSLDVPRFGFGNSVENANDGWEADEENQHGKLVNIKVRVGSLGRVSSYRQ